MLLVAQYIFFASSDREDGPVNYPGKNMLYYWRHRLVQGRHVTLIRTNQGPPRD